VVNVITKSGTNALHGALYEFVRNSEFDAVNFFTSPGANAEYRQNQFGGALGGAIRKNKTFFFMDYDGLRIVQAVAYLSTVPTLFEQKNPGNLTDIGGPVLPASQLNPISQPVSRAPKPMEAAAASPIRQIWVLVARTKGSDPDRHERKARTATKSTANPAGTGPPGQLSVPPFRSSYCEVHMTSIGHKERHNRTTIVELTRPLLTLPRCGGVSGCWMRRPRVVVWRVQAGCGFAVSCR